MSLEYKAKALIAALEGEARSHPVDLAFRELKAEFGPPPPPAAVVEEPEEAANPKVVPLKVKK